MILSIFKLIGIDKPSYIDVGANHPHSISNTHLLYTRGSRGVNIEANPDAMNDFKIHRPEDLSINVGIGPKEGVFEFYQFDNRSGRNTFSRENAKPFFHVGRTFISSPINMNMITLKSAIDLYCGGKFPDFMSIDIEGLDEEVLMSTDLTHGPKVICTEQLTWVDTSELKRYLATQGYFCYCRMHHDLFFVKEEYKDKLY